MQAPGLSIRIRVQLAGKARLPNISTQDGHGASVDLDEEIGAVLPFGFVQTEQTKDSVGNDGDLVPLVVPVNAGLPTERIL